MTFRSSDWLAIDGKALASTVTDADTSYQNVVSLVSLFSHTRGQVLKVGTLDNQKRREIPTVRTLIEPLDLQGMVFSLDALSKKPSRRSSTAEMTT